MFFTMVVSSAICSWWTFSDWSCQEWVLLTATRSVFWNGSCLRVFFLVGEEETYKCLIHVMGISNVKTEANKLSSKAQTSSEKNALLVQKKCLKPCQPVKIEDLVRKRKRNRKLSNSLFEENVGQLKFQFGNQKISHKDQKQKKSLSFLLISFAVSCNCRTQVFSYR